MSGSTAIILTGTLVAWLCGVLGVFLVLRKMSMLGDAISHAVLPGIVLAYLVSGDRSSPLLLIGAAVFGVAVTLLIEGLTRKAGMQRDASVGTSFTLFFSVGIILVSLFASQVDIDADCVLHGEIALVPFDTWSLGNTNMGPKQISILGGSLLLVLLVLWRGYKGFYLTSFNTEYAASLGMATMGWHYVLMSGVSLATVVSFEAVGAILVVAFLVIPPAAAWIWSKRLPEMIALTMLIGALSAWLGYQLARWTDSSISAGMSVAALSILILTILVHPSTSPWKKWFGRRVISPHKPF
jgi:manganese/zinc/iron transport system permease protein